MNKLISIFTILLMAYLYSCDIADLYTSTYQYKYRRPIGMMMSSKLDGMNLTGQSVKIGVIDAGFAETSRLDTKILSIPTQLVFSVEMKVITEPR